MSKPGDIYLGESGSEILLSPFGRSFSRGIIELNRETRTASGRLVRDVITTKNKFTISYSLIGGLDLQNIRELYEIQDELSLIIYNSAGMGTTTTPVPDAYTVLLGPFDQERVILLSDGLWGNVQLSLEEV
jgi:hypothetical protein